METGIYLVDNNCVKALGFRPEVELMETKGCTNRCTYQSVLGFRPEVELMETVPKASCGTGIDLGFRPEVELMETF